MNTRVTEIMLANDGAYERHYVGDPKCPRKMSDAVRDVVEHIGWEKFVRYSMATHQTGAGFETFREAIEMEGIKGYPVAAWFRLIVGDEGAETSTE